MYPNIQFSINDAGGDGLDFGQPLPRRGLFAASRADICPCKLLWLNSTSVLACWTNFSQAYCLHCLRHSLVASQTKWGLITKYCMMAKLSSRNFPAAKCLNYKALIKFDVSLCNMKPPTVQLHQQHSFSYFLAARSSVSWYLLSWSRCVLLWNFTLCLVLIMQDYWQSWDLMLSAPDQIFSILT